MKHDPGKEEPDATRSALLSMVGGSVGIYGSAPTCHLSALARLDDYALADLDRAVEEDRELVRVRAMRYSVYTLPRDLLVIALAARRPETERTFRTRSKSVDGYEGYARRVEEALAEGPLPTAEIREHADPDGELGSRFSLVIARMAAECRLVRATTTGSWRSNRLTYARWDRWLPDVDPWSLEPEEARPLLVERYVAAYGPVGEEDVAWWAGWTRRDTREAVDPVDLSTQGDALELLEGTRLLPVWDVLMVAYRHRERLLEPEHERFIYDDRGNATSVVLADGRVVGIWDLGSEDDPLTIRVAPLGTWSERRWGDVGVQAHRIGSMVGASDVRVERVETPVDLHEAKRNRFLSPLSGSDI